MPTLYPAGQTPYCSLAELLAAPTGISWSSLPPGRDVPDAVRQAEQVNLLMRATARADGVTNQVLRSTLDVEQVAGPGYYMMPHQNSTRIILSRWPVVSVLAVQVSPDVFPRQWTSLPAGMWDVVRPVVGLYGTTAPSGSGDGGQSIVIAPGYVSWANGRGGYLARVTYVNGWPHTSLTQPAVPVTSGTQQIQVDDCTGWAVTGEFGLTGAAGTMFDSGAQETVVCTAASVQAGPGTLTLAQPLQYAHAAGVMVTAMPQTVMDAVILFCAAGALQRGATSTTVHAIPGGSGGGGSAGTIKEYIQMGKNLLHPFRRTI